MTRDNLLQLEHTASTVGEYITITAAGGYRITSWKEGEDIAAFSSFTQSYLPIKDSYSDYRVITQEEADRLQAECDKAVAAIVPPME